MDSQTFRLPMDIIEDVQAFVMMLFKSSRVLHNIRYIFKFTAIYWLSWPYCHQKQEYYITTCTLCHEAHSTQRTLFTLWREPNLNKESNDHFLSVLWSKRRIQKETERENRGGNSCSNLWPWQVCVIFWRRRWRGSLSCILHRTCCSLERSLNAAYPEDWRGRNQNQLASRVLHNTARTLLNDCSTASLTFYGLRHLLIFKLK